MALYAIAREGATPVAGAMLLGITTGLQEIAQVNEVSIGGEATTSTVNRMAIRRSTTNLTTPTAQTPSKMSTTSPAAYSDCATTATGEPTTAAAPAIWTYALNVFGGVIRWVAAPGQALLVQGATAGNNELTLESASGTGVISCQMLFEEI